MMFYEYSGIGSYHLSKRGENQDAVRCDRRGNYSVISLADGVSTCKAAKRGAEIASRTLSEWLLRERTALLESEQKMPASRILSPVLSELKRIAEREHIELSEYSSTLAGVLIDERTQRAYCVNLGDGIIFACYPDRCRLLAMPDDSFEGCYVTTTKHVETVLSQQLLDISGANSVMICSDGAWKHLYDRNRLKPEAVDMLVNCRYDALKQFLIRQDCFDDFSFVSADLRRDKKGNAA